MVRNPVSEICQWGGKSLLSILIHPLETPDISVYLSNALS